MDPEGGRDAIAALASALAGIEDHVAIYDPAWRYVFVNQSAAAMLGTTREEMLGRCIWELYPDAVGNQYYRELHQAAAERRAIHSEHHYQIWDRWFENHIYPFYQGVLVITTEITERKRAEARREQLLAQLDTVVRQMPAAIMIADAEGSLIFCNEQVKVLTGVELPMNAKLAEQEITGYRRDGRRVAPGEWPMTRALLRGEVVRDEEIRIQRPDGTQIFIGVNAGPVRDPEGRITAAVLVFQDITERRRAEDALREADRRKDEFLAMLAHELRNPLAPILNAVQTLRLLGSSDSRRGWSEEVIERQVHHLSRLVDDLLDISRITQGKVALQRETIDLATAVSRAVETAKPLIDSRRHRLTLTLPAPPILLEADLVRLSQVIGNLLNNAAKYTPAEGRIELSAGLEGANAVLRVRDNGIGIAPELLPKIFDLFTQADRSLARTEGGLGIGLTLVRSLVEMHGGTVEALSRGAGRGSEFAVRLPALQASAAEISGSRPIAAGTAAGHRILVVDDNRDAAESLALLLSMHGHDVRTALDGATALDEARAFRPRVILLDLGLPRLDGYEVARRLRSEKEGDHPLLVAITGYGQAEDIRRSREAGFDHHLIKPVDFPALQELLSRDPARE